MNSKCSSRTQGGRPGTASLPHSTGQARHNCHCLPPSQHRAGWAQLPLPPSLTAQGAGQAQLPLPPSLTAQGRPGTTATASLPHSTGQAGHNCHCLPPSQHRAGRALPPSLTAQGRPGTTATASLPHSTGGRLGTTATASLRPQHTLATSGAVTSSTCTPHPHHHHQPSHLTCRVQETSACTLPVAVKYPLTDTSCTRTAPLIFSYVALPWEGQPVLPRCRCRRPTKALLILPPSPSPGRPCKLHYSAILFTASLLLICFPLPDKHRPTPATTPHDPSQP